MEANVCTTCGTAVKYTCEACGMALDKHDPTHGVNDSSHPEGAKHQKAHCTGCDKPEDHCTCKPM